MYRCLQKFLRDENGATAIEYGLIAAAIGLMLAVVMPQISSSIRAIFEDVIYSKVLQNAIN